MLDKNWKSNWLLSKKVLSNIELKKEREELKEILSFLEENDLKFLDWIATSDNLRCFYKKRVKRPAMNEDLQVFANFKRLPKQYILNEIEMHNMRIKNV